ncbi:hypothetical protein DY000_02041072 [Brassica cretica]|uniref:BRCT domain-containing protein n=1 Tax=Brassica cretica TaxID=69181 RepID=A0ABQ7BFD3_BRACR|nr:hypothetical protein DY000_02041072 [Brassica cretica]
MSPILDRITGTYHGTGDTKANCKTQRSAGSADSPSLATSWRKLNSVKKSVRGNYGPMVEHGLIIIGPYSGDKALTHVARVLSGEELIRVTARKKFDNGCLKSNLNMDTKDKRKDVGTPKYTSKEPNVIVGKNCLDRENSKPRKMEVSSGDVEGHKPSRHVPLVRCATMYLRRDAPPCASGETRHYAGIVTLTALLSSSFIPGSINPDSPSIVIILMASV